MSTRILASIAALLFVGTFVLLLFNPTAAIATAVLFVGCAIDAAGRGAP